MADTTSAPAALPADNIMGATGPRPLIIGQDPAFAEFAFFDETAMHEAEQSRYSQPLAAAVSVHQLPDVAYLRHAIVPLLVPALQEVARARPKDPIQFLAAYLVSNNPQRDAVLPTPAADFPVLMGRVPLAAPRPATPQVPATPVTSDTPVVATPGKRK